MLFFISVLFSLALNASPPTFSKVQFKKGAKWTWSYSRWSESKDDFEAPYLFETYKVVDIDGEEVTIEMSSGDELNHEVPPHHKFVVNLADCLEAGKSLFRFKRFRIQFYNRNSSGEWKLVSKKHKALAFTEKFNCLSIDKPYHLDIIDLFDQSMSGFRWDLDDQDSWYGYRTESEWPGVLLKRSARKIRILFVEPLL